MNLSTLFNNDLIQVHSTNIKMALAIPMATAIPNGDARNHLDHSLLKEEIHKDPK